MLIVVGISKDIGKHFANAVSHSAALAEKADSTQNPQITSSLNPGGNNPASAKSTQSEELNFECATWERSPEETLVNEMDFARNQKAAAAGSADGQYALGIMYAKGEGVSTDYVKAVEWYQKAAAQGHVNAQASLGEIYMLGNCIPKDTAKAQEWLQKAATQGNADAQFNLGEMYDYGKGVPEDDIKAFEWYKKAAAQGNAQAQASLGFMYDNGVGVLEDDVPFSLVDALPRLERVVNRVIADDYSLLPLHVVVDGQAEFLHREGGEPSCRDVDLQCGQP